MGVIYADIILINSDDIGLARKYVIGQEEIRRMTVKMLVDTGAYMMSISQSVRGQLGLQFIENRKAIWTDGTVREFEVVGPIMVKFKNRTACCNALVLQNNEESLLGAIPLEEMDVLIHPQRQELIVNPDHTYHAQLNMKQVYG